MDDIPNAIKTYDRLVTIPSLEPQLLKQTTYTLAQLNMMEEKYTRTLQLLDKWFAMEPNPAPEPFILKAQVLYQLQRYAEMVQPIEKGMAIARERDKPVKEDWYVLLNFAYFQQENYAKVRDIQKILLTNWPKKRYWFSLAGAYTELGEDQNLIAGYDAAFTDGLLEKESEFVTMAQLYMQREVPYKAGKLLEEKMKEGVVEKNEKNYRLLSQAWMLAQEDGKAIPALQEAAKRSTDGELDIRLANSYLNIGEYNECVDSAQTSLKKGALKNSDNAQITLGMCLYNLRKYADAKKAFQTAARVEKSRRMANQWIQVIDADVERNRQIEFAQEAARKKQKEVSDRRAKAGRV
jgi:tetratricopeptide (TPR) repeat protein